VIAQFRARDAQVQARRVGGWLRKLCASAGRGGDAVRYDEQVALMQMGRQGVVFGLEPEDDGFEVGHSTTEAPIVLE
jgi:hypothetical protein